MRIHYINKFSYVSVCLCVCVCVCMSGKSFDTPSKISQGSMSTYVQTNEHKLNIRKPIINFECLCSVIIFPSAGIKFTLL